MEIVLATKNVHKLREFREILKSFPHLDVVSLLSFPDYVPPEETGKTFQENAAFKAKHAARVLNKWVLADDSGLVVPSLKGAPGIYSARYAGSGATDAENRQKLLKAMQELTDLQRAGYFECCLALAGPQGLFKTVTGICEGHIVERERGNNGFGYDSLFCKHDYDKTFAELEEGIKNRISHRHKAVEKLRPTLETLKP